MFPRDQFVKATVQPGFGRGPSARQIASPDYGFDDIVVQRILVAAARVRPHTMGEFGHLTRPYLSAGYQREVAEAHRRYFAGASRG